MKEEKEKRRRGGREKRRGFLFADVLDKREGLITKREIREGLFANPKNIREIINK